MLVLTDIPMKTFRLCAAVVLIGLFSTVAVRAHDNKQDAAQLTPHEYETILERLLPCPEPQLRDTQDYQLCLLIIPPGHRAGERELLVVFSSRRGVVEMSLRQPGLPLWRHARDARAGGAPDWDSLLDVRVREFQTKDAKLVERVAGRSWTSLTIAVLPQADWFMDATRYRIRGTALMGSVAVELQGPGAVSRRQPSEVLSWAERVRREAERILDAGESH